MQLVGRQHAGRSASEVDLAALQRRGVRLTGRLREFTGGIARFADDLASRVSEAEARMHRFLDVADAYAERSGLVAEIWRPERPAPVTLPSTSPTRVDLRAEGIDTIVVASGYRPDHPWLQLPVLTADGRIGQHHGVTAVPGVYTVGQRGQHGRASGTIAGAAHDAAYVVDRIAGRTPTARLSPEEAA